jgi:prepilin peptidase CpaA
MEHAEHAITLMIPAALIVVLAICTISDLRERRIPNAVLLPALVFALALHGSSSGFAGIGLAVGGLAVGLLFLMPLYVMRGMGAGDVKLLGVAGAFLGPWGALVAGSMTLITGAVMGIAWVVWRSVGPVLSQYAANLLQPHAANQLHQAPAAAAGSSAGKQTFAYAPAIAAGALFALWEKGLLAGIAFG